MESIAIVGIGCRFPGASNPQAFWELMCKGVDAIAQVPQQRWNIDDFYDPNPATPSKMYTRWGGFLEQIDQFDPGFFKISPREANYLDPQQRLLLEVAWEALENAAIVPENLAGSPTGVFIGIGNSDYHRLIYKRSSSLNAYSGTGTSFSITANRLSYLLDLRGPSMAVDTGCSGSLVAVHLACQSLQNLESNLCLVGGVNLIVSPEQTIAFSQARMMSSDGRCKTFDASADGYVRGEGCGVVVLKRLADALEHGDRILAIIRGSAVNQDGLSNGLTAPNGPAQQAVIRQALANAKVQPAQISYVEAHGTGTSLGDPIEMKSLKAVLSERRSLDQPCWIGSVKTNIGHLEAAAGIAGLIKVVLCLQHQEIPPHLYLKQLNPYISLAGTPFAIPTERQSWYVSTEPRLAGVSSFSFGGTNSHVILQEAPVFSQVVQDDIKRPWHLLTLSAKTEKALQQLAERYENYLINHPEASIADICFTANTGRSHFAHRLAVVVSSREQLIEKLAAGASGKETSGLFSNQAGKKLPQIAFLFTGQGSQYINMGRQLYKTQPTFRKTLDYCAQILSPDLEKPLLEVLYPTVGETSPLNETVYAQPALFALEYALFDLWKSWGVEPSAVMGHSVGEYVAATVAGVFSLEDGLKLIATRARLMQQLSSSGDVSHASMLAKFEAVAKEITYNRPRIPLISNLTGQLATPEIATPEYWVNHVRQAMNFAQSMQTLHQEGYKFFLEIGPKPILLEMSRQCLPEDAPIWLPSLCPPQEDWQQMLSSLGLLYVNGMKIDWSGFDKDYVRCQLALPSYPFQRQRYWLETSENGSPENGHQKDILENSSSLIVNLLNQVDPKQLAQELNIAEELTEQEQKLLPKLLTILINRQSSEPGAGILQQLKKAPERDRLQLITNYLQSVVAQLLGFHDSPSPDSQLGFFDMGMDYSMMLELRDLLQKNFGCYIAVTTLSEHFNIQELAKYLHEEIFGLKLEEELEIDKYYENEKRRSIVNGEIETLDEDAIANAIKQEIIATAIQNELKEIQLLLNQEN